LFKKRLKNCFKKAARRVLTDKKEHGKVASVAKFGL
jgi:hypothetical protein